jgi:hypothetical protein
VQKEADLSVSFTAHGLPVVDVQIDGKTEHMILDTGSVVTTLTPRAAAALNLRNLMPSPLTMVGIGGEQKNLPSTYLNIDMGGWHILNTLTLIVAQGPALLEASSGVDGSIGTNMLKPFDIDYDLPDRGISLYLSPGCIPDTSPPPWPPPYGVLSSYDRLRDESYVEIMLDGTPLPAVIDSGATTTLAPSALLKLEGIFPKKTEKNFATRAIGYGPKTVTLTFEQFGNITIGDESYANPWLPVADNHDDVQTVILGENYLRDHRVFVANSTQVVYLGLMVSPNKK